MKLTMEQIEHEMKVISDSGMEEILILTGESRAQSNVEYIGAATYIHAAVPVSHDTFARPNLSLSGPNIFDYVEAAVFTVVINE